MKLRARLPRLADLHARFVQDARENFFRNFANWFDESDVTLRYYEQIERDMSFIPTSEWDAYAAKVGAAVNICNRKHRRDWEKLFDVFNEALGARTLVRSYGCETVRLMPASTTSQSCDWFGEAGGKPHYLEVKTLNHSDDERRSWYDEAKLVHTCSVPAPLLKKGRDLYEKAKSQLDAMPRAAEAKKAVLFVIDVDHNFDPVSASVRHMLLHEFERFEDPTYEMHLAIHTVYD